MWQLQKEGGEIEEDEVAVAGLAKEYFEEVGKGVWDNVESVNDKVQWSPDFSIRKVGEETKSQLGSPISYEEVVKAIKSMKKGKGVGGDKVSSEMLLEGGEMLWHNLHALLQVCWDEEFIPEEWMEGIIVPLHKEGSEKDLGNYRGITLSSHIGKVFCRVLKERLCRAVDGVVLGEAQGGFRKNRQTVDHLFVVNGVCQLRRGEGKKTWLAFLDLRKAYDSVWREGLWEKMDRYGIGGKFLRVCQALYSSVKARVRVGATLSEEFEIRCGLRQGCVLSPCLFSLFIMDLAWELEEKGLGVKVRGQWVGSCLFADDIALLASSASELQAMLDVAAEFASKWRLKFNPKKCGILVVGQKKQQRKWHLGRDRIDEVDEYKYLGVWVNRQANGHSHVRHLEEKAAKLQGLARKAKFWRGAEDVEAGLVMWEVACKPRLVYGSEVWACSSSSEEKSLEQIQERTGRVVLGVSWRFPGVVVRGDLGWVKLKSERHVRALNYAGRLRAMDEGRWPKIVALALRERRGIGSWVDYGESLITVYGLREEWEKGGWKERRWKLMVKESVKKEAGRQWVEEVERRNDLGQYGSRQTALGRADYIKGFGRGNEIRAEIKSRCKWGDHWVD